MMAAAAAAAVTSNNNNISGGVQQSPASQMAMVQNGAVMADQKSPSLMTHHHHQKASAADGVVKQEPGGSKSQRGGAAAAADDSDDDTPLMLRKRKTPTQTAAATPASQQKNGYKDNNKSSTAAAPKKDPKLEKTSPSTSGKSSTSTATPLGVKIKLVKPSAVVDESDDDDEDNKPLSARKSAPSSSSKHHHDVSSKKTASSNSSSNNNNNRSSNKNDHKGKKRKNDDDDDDEDFSPARKSKSTPSTAKKARTDATKTTNSNNSNNNNSMEKKKKESQAKANAAAVDSPSPTKKKKNAEQEQEVWRWWEEVQHGDGVKWKFLEHRGPVFAPPYDPLPDNVKFFYDGKEMKLSQNTEEVATFYGKMLDHEYTTKDTFNTNFFKDWRKVMTSKEREVIKDLSKCDFNQMNDYFKKLSEERKAMSKEEKQKLKEEKDVIQKDYGVAVVDGHKEKIGNFRIEPPGLFRGRGTHPKMGMLKKRVMPEDVIINCSKDSKIPSPPPGRKWKEVRHDKTVTWLACWTENIMGSIKYVMLNPSSKIKGEKDWAKYEMARKLNKCVDKIRRQYREDWKSKEMKVRQRAVAMYFIDKLALRAGNEKEEGETADTVGCCSLRCEHLKLYDELDGQECVVEFDFLGKDSIRYYNRVPVEKRVFKNLKLFMENKDPGDDVFDRLNTGILNKHLQSLMDGLTAKVFRTYNASHTLQEQLDLLTKPEMSVAEKLLAYNRANRQVAILCNHQRAVPKTHDKQMENLQSKIKEKEDVVKSAKQDLKAAKSDYKAHKNEKTKKALEQRQRQYDRVQEQLQKLQLRATDKEENKEIALGTSKLNYLDPRISVAWCKKYGVAVEKIYNKTQREKFRWAIDMAGPEFVF